MSDVQAVLMLRVIFIFVKIAIIVGFICTLKSEENAVQHAWRKELPSNEEHLLPETGK